MPQLKKEISFYGLTMVAIGACIGSGIFLTPSQIASNISSPSLIILAWVLGGLVATMGALTFSELGGMFPKTGGVYVYLKEAYGKWMGFLYGWSILLVITSGAIAALSRAFAQYLNFLVPMDDFMLQVVAVFVIVLVTLVNIFGVKIAEFFASFLTSTKLIGIGLIVLLGLFFTENLEHSVDFSLSSPDSGIRTFVLGLIGVMWSYGGWHHASYLAGETKNASKIVPRAMVFGAFVVTLTYVLVNVAYIYLLPIDQIASSKAVASDAVAQVLPFGGHFITILIMLSVFGTAGIYTLSAPRIYFAMAQDGVFFKKIAQVHPKYKTPINAIILQSVWAIVLLLFWGTFENLISYVVFTDAIFMILAGISLFIFRKKSPNLPRPYQVILYPIVPILYIGLSLFFTVYWLIGQPLQAVAGLILIGVGLIFYFVLQKLNNT